MLAILITYNNSYAGTCDFQCVLIIMGYTHLIAAAGTQPHHICYTFLLNQVVSYQSTVCRNKNIRCDYYELHMH